MGIFMRNAAKFTALFVAALLVLFLNGCASVFIPKNRVAQVTTVPSFRCAECHINGQKLDTLSPLSSPPVAEGG